MDETTRSERMQRRLGARLTLGAAIGAVAGAIVGFIVGAVASTPGHRAFWMILLACTIFAAMFGALLGGYSSLESPDPGREPSDTERPVADRPELTREERP